LVFYTNAVNVYTNAVISGMKWGWNRLQLFEGLKGLGIVMVFKLKVFETPTKACAQGSPLERGRGVFPLSCGISAGNMVFRR
jgi:hypothetical protein